MFLERLLLEDCDSIDDVSLELFPRARYLSVDGCHRLTGLLIPTGTEEVCIYQSENLEILSVACGTEIQMMSLRHLKIHKCEKLKLLPEHMHEILPSLKHLELKRCPEIESFPEGGLPSSLEELDVIHCKKLVNGQKEWQLQRLPCLTDLSIEHDGSDEKIHWELPASIRRLRIFNLKTLNSQVLKSLPSLEYLSTENLPQVQSLLEEGLPSSLSKLILYHHCELHSLPQGLGRLTLLQCIEIHCCHQLQFVAESVLSSFLSKLKIRFCHNLQSIAESALPSSLSKLRISHCDNLQSIAESVLPSSLSELSIRYCHNLQSLPVKGMPSSISRLFIEGCPSINHV